MASFTAEKPIFMKMAEVTNFSQMDTEQQRIYMRSLNNYRTVLATNGYDLNRGIAIGRAEGERLKAIAVATSLLSMDMSLDKIAQVTGLAIDEIKSINA